MSEKNPIKLLQQYNTVRKTLMAFSCNGKDKKETDEDEEKISSSGPKKAYT